MAKKLKIVSSQEIPQVKENDLIAREVDDTQMTTAGLRVTLFSEIDAIRRGQSTPQQSNAISKLSAQIIASAHLDLKYQSKLESKGGSVPRPVMLGVDK